jgi:hypothetical protein
LPRYLAHLAEHRANMTIVGGVSHPDNSGGHMVEKSFLTGARFPSSPMFKNSVSLDQFAVEKIGHHTRFPFLALAVNGKHDGLLSVTRDGIFLPPELSPSRLYHRLFTEDTPEQSGHRLREIGNRTSILDSVSQSARRLENTLGAADRERLDQYFTSVRELEQRLEQAAAWQKRPKPRPQAAAPVDIPDGSRDQERAALMYDMAKLALESDSTRFITLYLNPLETNVKLPGVSDRTHALTHHGNEPEKIAELRKIEEAQIVAFGGFLQSLRDVNEGDGSLLDQTQVLYGSCLGNANSHSNQNLPLILAGGGFKHPGHLAFDETRNEPMAKLFLTMLNRLGVEVGSFASCSSTLRGLDS